MVYLLNRVRYADALPYLSISFPISYINWLYGFGLDSALLHCVVVDAVVHLSLIAFPPVSWDMIGRMVVNQYCYKLWNRLASFWAVSAKSLTRGWIIGVVNPMVSLLIVCVCVLLCWSLPLWMSLRSRYEPLSFVNTV
jgi:hypothetical protein